MNTTFLRTGTQAACCRLNYTTAVRRIRTKDVHHVYEYMIPGTYVPQVSYVRTYVLSEGDNQEHRTCFRRVFKLC